MRIEGSNAFHRVFHAADAVGHTASPTRGAIVVGAVMDGHRPAVRISDRYTAQQGHAAQHQICLAHLARDIAYVVVLREPQDEGQRRSRALAPAALAALRVRAR